MESKDNINWVQEQNTAVKGWANMVTRKLKSSALQFKHGKSGMVQRGSGTKYQRNEDKLVNSIGRKIYMASGLAEGIGFKIERHGVFVHKGVGRGYIMEGGVVIRGYRTESGLKKQAKNSTRSVASKQKTTGTMNRHPAPWFNPVIENTVPELADKIAVINADAVINELHAKIK
jgi:hypothetical protein